jgi:hypothetical protein
MIFMKIPLLVLLLFSSSAFAAEGDFSWNIRTQPLLWVVAPNLRADYKLSDQFTLGLAGTALDNKIKGVKLKGTTGALILNYNFSSSLANGGVVELGVVASGLSAEAKDASGQVFTRTLANSGGRFLLGYQWFWDHFNLSVGAGADYNSQGGKYVEDSNGNKLEKIPLYEVAFASEGVIGWAF